MMARLTRLACCIITICCLHVLVSEAFQGSRITRTTKTTRSGTTARRLAQNAVTTLMAKTNTNSNDVQAPKRYGNHGDDDNSNSHFMMMRRRMLQQLSSMAFVSTAALGLHHPSPAAAAAEGGGSGGSGGSKNFTPGGTLVDREVGVTVGNPEASASRKADNSNVLFSQDHYFKFGVAAPWIEPGSTEFPKTMPFVLSQQRYDSLKKYGDRIKKGLAAIDSLGGTIESSGGAASQEVADPSSPDYALRPMGLMANGFMASENTGTTNELLLARWYINEMYLHIGDVRGATSKADALKSYAAVKKAANSYLSMLNRVITSKVGDKFDLLSVEYSN